MKSFYSSLYTSCNPDLNDPSFSTIADLKLPQLSAKDMTELETEISLDECYYALNAMPENKSPGHDGFGVEFYKTFWDTIGTMFLQTLKYSLSEGELTESQRRAVITLIQKKGKDETLIKNWRPISLLNCDYKIFTKVLSLRIKAYLPKIIHEDQVGFVPDRFIGENIRYIEDLVEYSNRLKEKCILLSIDIEKAFDTLEWDFILHALHKFNFGPNIIKWIRTCYKNIYSTVINNGFSSGWFQIHRGVRQGCSLSCILFVLAIEIMATLIRKNESIVGVNINNCNRKLIQFADDTTCILRNINSINALFNTLTYFGKFSGQRLNMEKSVLVWLGPWK